MFSKINILGIVREHCRTLRNFESGRISAGDWALFLGVPVLVAMILLWLEIYLNDTAVTTLLACYAILAGLLINLLMLIFDLIRNERVKAEDSPAEKTDKQLKAQLLQQTFANISFCVLSGIVLALLCILGMKDALVIRIPVSALVYVGSANFVLTLLMVLKRIHTLLSREFSEQAER